MVWSILYIEFQLYILSTSFVNSIGLNIVPISMDNEGLSITELKRKYKNSSLFLLNRGNIVNNICLSHISYILYRMIGISIDKEAKKAAVLIFKV